jgi:hypothetical protein
MTRSARSIPVPSDEFYTAPETTRSRVAEQMRQKLPKVDQNGRVIVVAAPVPAPPVAVPAASDVADTIRVVADDHGVDLGALADSAQFMAGVAKLEVTDTEGIAALIQEAVVRNPRIALGALTMRPNPAQGGSAMPLVTPQTVRDRVRAMIAKTPIVDAQGHRVDGRII